MRKTLSTGINYIGAAIKEGQTLSGVDTAPDALRNSGLFDSLKKKFNVEVKDYGNISLKELNKTGNIIHPDPAQQTHQVRNLHLLDPLLHELSNTCTRAIEDNPDNIQVTVGGDHSVATGSIHALMKKHNDLKVIWVDAHPDMSNVT